MRMFFPPAKRWKQVSAVDPDREYVAFTSRFYMKSPRRVLRFLARTGGIEKQVDEAPGVVGWSLAANLFKMEFYTLSAWEDAESLQRFAREAEHGAVSREFELDMRRPSLFVHYGVKGRDLPLSWKDAVIRQDAVLASSE
jgi:heme-degrading monooxygenase HmoA